VQKEGHTPELVAKEERLALGLDNSAPLLREKLSLTPAM
jgi:hypothetical protein